MKASPLRVGSRLGLSLAGEQLVLARRKPARVRDVTWFALAAEHGSRCGCHSWCSRSRSGNGDGNANKIRDFFRFRMAKKSREWPERMMSWIRKPGEAEKRGAAGRLELAVDLPACRELLPEAAAAVGVINELVEPECSASCVFHPSSCFGVHLPAGWASFGGRTGSEERARHP